jgi:hypothetical protein
MTNKLLQQLDELPVNKTVVFSILIEKILVRTVTTHEHSFFHAVLYACLPNYKLINTKNHVKLINELRSYIISKLYKTVPYTVFLEETIIMLLSNFYNFISTGKCNKLKSSKKIRKKVIINESDIKTYKFITEMITIDELKNNILLITSNNVDVIKNFKPLKETLDEYNKKLYTEKISILIKAVVKESNKYFSENYKINVDSKTIKLISNKLNIDIYFIDSKTRMPCKSSNIKKRKSIIIMLNENGHYDIVGKLLPDNVIKREFDPEESIITKIYSHLYKKKD